MNSRSMDRQIHPLALLLMAIIFLVATFLKLTMLKLMLLYFVLLPYLFQKQSDIKLHLKKFT
jgi:hypothetical protein